MRILLLLTAALSLVFVALFGLPASAKDGEVRLPELIVSFANDTKPGGALEMELDADGRLWGLEAEIPLDQVPPACLAQAEKVVPGGTSVGAEKEWADGSTYYEVVREKDGVRFEILMKADGTVVGGEEALKPGAAPEAVLKAADAAVPGGTLVVAEKVSGVEARGSDEFHIKKMVDGEVQRISVTPDGKVVRVLRKMKAEVRVPRR